MDHCRSFGSMWTGPKLSGGHCPEADTGFPVEARLPHSHIVSALADSTSQTMGPTVDLSCLSKIKETWLQKICNMHYHSKVYGQ